MNQPNNSKHATKWLLCACLALIAPTFALSEEVFRIEVGRDYKHYSNTELQRRVWELERAVWQLQQRVFQLEVSKGPTPLPVSDSWLCTISAMGETYTGTGGSKAVATARVIESCKAGRKGDTFFCKDAKCEQ